MSSVDSTNTSQAPNFNFPEKKASSEEKALIDDVLKLCTFSFLPWNSNLECDVVDVSTDPLVDQLNPVSAAYARYSPDATFHDPVSIAKGLDSIVSFAYTEFVDLHIPCLLEMSDCC